MIAHSKNIEWYYDLEAEGKPVPALENRPTLFEDLIPYWQAFWDLDGSRNIGFSAGAIPITEITTYLKEILGLTDKEEIREYFKWIRVLDKKYLEISKREKPKKGKPPKGKNK